MGTIVFTGPASVRGTRIVRENLINLAAAKGHRVAGSIVRGTDYLVTSTPHSGSRKNRDAARLGVSLITPEQFIEMCGGKIELRLKDLT